MALFGNKKPQNDPVALSRLDDERRLLANLQPGIVLGDFVVICRTDYTQSFSDQWIARYDYKWYEYLLLTKDLLRSPNDLSALIYLPQDLSEVYYVVVPPQSPDFTHLTAQGQRDYDLTRGYEAAVNAALQRDYAALPKRSVYHSVDPQPAGNTWMYAVEDVLSGRKQNVVVDYNGIRYNFNIPSNPKEAEASAFTALALRRGAYPGEESLRFDNRFDIVPALPDGVTGRVTVREFVSDRREKAPFPRLSFQRTELPPEAVAQSHPPVMHDLSMGEELGPDDSLINYLNIKYVQLQEKNPAVRIVGYF